MAKILFVSEKINDTSWTLATALKSNNNEVLFLTSHGQNVQTEQNIQILGYFKKWSTLEALRFLPMLLTAKIDIVHFLLETDNLNAAQSFLSTACLALPRLAISTSLLNISNGLTRKNPVRYLLERSDLVTAPTVDMLAQLRGLNVKNLKQLRGVIPPIIPSKYEIQDKETSGRIAHLLVSTEKKDFIIVPLQSREYQSHELALPPLIALSKKFFLIFQGSLQDWTVSERKLWEKVTTEKLGHNWCLSGNLDTQEENDLLEKSCGLFLAGHDLPPLKMTQWLGRSAHSGTTLIVDDRQTRLYPGLWEHQKNSWVFSRVDLASEIERWIESGPPSLSSNLTESLRLRQDLLDAPLNELHRLYNRLPLF
ncbi:MAG: hypothetical protein AABY64_07565 [Bdellovibrionota bacterium]